MPWVDWCLSTRIRNLLRHFVAIAAGIFSFLADPQWPRKKKPQKKLRKRLQNFARILALLGAKAVAAKAYERSVLTKDNLEQHRQAASWPSHPPRPSS